MDIQATALKSVRSLVPLLDRVLVQRLKAESKTASGIFLPESSLKELNEAKVLAVGPGGLDKDGKRIPMGVQTGDKVLIPQVCCKYVDALPAGRIFHFLPSPATRCDLTNLVACWLDPMTWCSKPWLRLSSMEFYPCSSRPLLCELPRKTG